MKDCDSPLNLGETLGKIRRTGMKAKTARYRSRKAACLKDTCCNSSCFGSTFWVRIESQIGPFRLRIKYAMSRFLSIAAQILK